MTRDELLAGFPEYAVEIREQLKRLGPEQPGERVKVLRSVGGRLVVEQQVGRRIRQPGEPRGVLVDLVAERARRGR